MKTISNTLYTAVCLIILSSCTIYKNIPIEVLRTKEVKLSSSAPKISLLYRNFKFNNDTLQNYFLRNVTLYKDRNNQGKDIDSIVVTSCLQSVANSFVQNSVCHDPVIFPYDIFPRQTGDRIYPLPADLIKKLAKPAQAEFIILLETFSYFFSQTSDAEEGEFQEVKLAGIWTMYNAVTGEIADRKTITDTVYWNPGDNPGNLAKEKFPPRLPALQQAAEVFGENYAKRFYSNWTKVDRLLIVPPLEDFRLAAEFTDKQQWDKASEIWEKYSDRRFGRLAVSACYNLALVREIKDELDEAVIWINKAMGIAESYRNSDEMELTGNYQKILVQRQHDIEKAEKVINP
jgi:hypothetical protein